MKSCFEIKKNNIFITQRKTGAPKTVGDTGIPIETTVLPYLKYSYCMRFTCMQVSNQPTSVNQQTCVAAGASTTYHPYSL